MINQHLRVPTAIHVLVQALVDEVLEFGGPLGRDARWLILHDVEQNAGVMLRNVRRLSLGKLDCKDTKRPDINLVSVFTMTLNQLWCHPTDRADLALTTLLLLSKHDSITEICQLDLTVSLHEDVI